MEAPAKAPAPPRLSTRQARILEVVRESYRVRGRAPTRREIADGAGLSSTSVADYNLKKLERLGLLELEGIARGIRIVRREGEPCPLCGCPGGHEREEESHA